MSRTERANFVKIRLLKVFKIKFNLIILNVNYKLFVKKTFPLVPVSWTGPRGKARSRILSGLGFFSLCLMYFDFICTVSAAVLVFFIVCFH